jgi:hypothetical protein
VKDGDIFIGFTMPEMKRHGGFFKVKTSIPRKYFVITDDFGSAVFNGKSR